MSSWKLHKLNQCRENCFYCKNGYSHFNPKVDPEPVIVKEAEIAICNECNQPVDNHVEFCSAEVTKVIPEAA